MHNYRFLILAYLFFSLTGLGKVWGQCGPCIAGPGVVILNNNENPGTIPLPSGTLVCLTGTRTANLALSTSGNTTVRVNGDFNSGTITYTNTNRINIEVCGGNFAGTVTLNNTSSSLSVAATRTYSGSLTVTNGSVTNNGTISNLVTLTNSSTYTNSGTHSGNLAMNGTSSLTNSGTLNLTLLTIGGSSLGITNTSTGSIIVDQNNDLDINAPFHNEGVFRFINKDKNVLIPSGVTVTNTGSFEVAKDFENDGTFNSPDGTLTVGKNLINKKNGVLNLGNTTVAGDFTSENLTTIAGSLEVGKNLENKKSAVIRPLNTDQCNTIFVKDNFDNKNNNGITGENLSGPYRAPLIVNKAPSDKEVTEGAIIDPSLDCSCGSTFTNSGSFIVPSGVTQLTLKAWGGGGKGGSTTGKVKAGGGGAGAYSESTTTVTPGETLYYFSGVGSTTTIPGGDSWVSRASNGTNPILLAKGGNSVANNITIGASGGLASQGVGTGTDGGKGSNAGGDGGDGGDAPNGGDGGPGATGKNQDGSNGNAPGGGGGGAKTDKDGETDEGGNGGNGQISFSYSCDETVDPPVEGCWRYIDDGSGSGVVIIEFYNDCTWNAPQGLLEFEVLAIGGGGGGGAHSGGGGGSGGIVHAKVDISKVSVFGLLADTPFDISIGKGSIGSQKNDEKANDGNNSIFNSTGTFHTTAGGIYRLTAGGGGGGGSDRGDGKNTSGKGSPGVSSSKSNESNMSSLKMYHGSGGGASHPENNGGNGLRNGGNGSIHSGGGGGGVFSPGENGNASKQGGAGGTGLQFNEFDINQKRYFGGGGGGGSDASFLAPGGSGAGGNGAYIGPGQSGKTPGSGGGGGGHSGDEKGGKGADGVVFVKYETAKILPVEFLFFKATYNSPVRTGDLTWSTAKEWENSHFEIERSVNDTRNWIKVGEVTGKGYSDVPVEYRYIDQNLPVAGGNIFYRLKQVDFDGSFNYSNTKAILVEALEGNTSWIAYPNPSALRSFITVDLLDRSGYADESILIRISDGRGVFESYSASSPDEVSAVVNSYLDQANPGIHILQLIWGNKSEQLKLIRK